MSDDPQNLVLLQLRGLRGEMAALLERQVRDRELISRIYNELTSFRSEMREEVRDLRSDLVLLENQLQSRHNELLNVIRRLDAIGAPPD